MNPSGRADPFKIISVKFTDSPLPQAPTEGGCPVGEVVAVSPVEQLAERRGDGGLIGAGLLEAPRLAALERETPTFVPRRWWPAFELCCLAGDLPSESNR